MLAVTVRPLSLSTSAFLFDRSDHASFGKFCRSVSQIMIRIVMNLPIAIDSCTNKHNDSVNNAKSAICEPSFKDTTRLQRVLTQMCSDPWLDSPRFPKSPKITQPMEL
jgi:hypothetical protein